MSEAAVLDRPAQVIELPVEAPEDSEQLQELEARIAEARATRESLESEFRQRKTEITGLIRSLEDQRRALAKQRSGARKRGPLEAHKQAGKRNVAAMLVAAQRHRNATQAELAQASGVGTGSTTWAIRALVEDGVLVPTGERRDGSRVFRYVPKAQRSGTSRTLAPGE